MTERPSAKRLADIRKEAACGFVCTRSYLEVIAVQILAELDAVTRERDEAQKRVSGLLDQCARLINCREALRGEWDDAMRAKDDLLHDLYMAQKQRAAARATVANLRAELEAAYLEIERLERT